MKNTRTPPKAPKTAAKAVKKTASKAASQKAAATPGPTDEASPGFMNWSDRYAVGVGIIDTQHQVLFRLIDQLATDIADGHPDEHQQELFEKLSEYTITHFATEERLMAESGFVESAEHLAQHQKLKRSLKDLVDRARANEALVSLETMNFLRLWLIHHIDDTDRALAAHLNGVNAK